MPQAKHSPMVIAAARELCKRSAEACRIDYEDSWKLYGPDYLADAQAAFDAAGVQAVVNALDMARALLVDVENYTVTGPSIKVIDAALTRATGA